MKAKRRLLLLGSVMAVAAMAAIASAGAPAASACVPPNCPVVTGPLATTSPATGVTSNSATLTGTVTPNGHTTTCVFEYGTTAAYGYRTSNQTVHTSPTATKQSLTTVLAGIEAGRAFHYRLTCSNTGGTSNGADASFSTPSGPTTASVIRLSGHTGFVSGTGMAGVFIGCYGSQGCSGSLTLTHAGKVIGRRSSYAIPANSGGIVHVGLNRSARKQLRKAGQLGVLVASSLSNGTQLNGNRKITLHLFH